MGSVRALAAVVALAGCYKPSPATGVPCTPEGQQCPGDQKCVDGICGGLPIDAATGDDAAPGDDAAIDAPIDAPPAIWMGVKQVGGVNTSSDEDDPSFTPDRLTIVFTSERNGGLHDIFIGTRPNTNSDFTVIPVDAVNMASDENSPDISADGLTLYFTSDRLMAGSGDVYVSRRTAVTAAFGPPLLEPLLSAAGADETDLAISPDGLTVIVSRDGAFLRATRAKVTDPWPAPVAIGNVNFGVDPAAPALATSGNLYFHAGAQRDLFFARKNGASFDPPVPITELETAGRDSGPFVSPDEKHLMWARSGQIFEATHP
jgi:WD40 repeat protein